MTAQYTYLATDLVTNVTLGELPLSGTSFDCQLNNAGNCTVGANLADTRIDNTEFIARTTPGKTALWAYRENQIVWGGILLTRTYEAEGKILTMTGQTFECYASRRYPRSVLGKNSQKLNIGRCATIDRLWHQMQSVVNGTIGVLPANVPPVDPTTTLTIHGWDLSTSYADLITSVTQLSDGPDWTIAWQEDGFGSPLKQLVVGLPIGNPVGMTDLEVDFPGPILDYTYTENVSNGANWWWSQGDGNGAAAIVGDAADGTSFISGYPIWESVNSYSGVTQQATINKHATSDLATKPMPAVTHSVVLEGDQLPFFGSYGMGDYMTANVVDERFPTGTTFNVRVIGWTISPPDENQGTEQITLVFDEATGGN